MGISLSELCEWVSKKWRKVNRIVKKFGKYRRKVSWIVKWYGKYGRKINWIVRHAELWKDMENMEEA
jgi:phage-related minor tail protein